MQELEPTWERVVSVWWLVVWRGVLGALLIGAAVGFVIGVAGTIAASMFGFPVEPVRQVSSVAGGIVGLGWGLVVVRMALEKRYKDFRIALVPVTAG